jgi:ribonuclease HI
MKDPRKKVIATYSLSTLMAASDKKETKNPETQTIRKLLEHEGAKITQLWVPSHVQIPGNKEADNATKESFGDKVEKTEYPRRT